MRPVLVVDDERFILDSVAFVLEQERLPFVTAVNGQMGLSLARSEHPSVVLLDVMLPDRSGWEICREIRASEGTSPRIIMLSARSQQEDLDEGRKAGADDYIVKPFSPKQLVEKIHDAMGR